MAAAPGDGARLAQLLAARLAQKQPVVCAHARARAAVPGRHGRRRGVPAPLLRPLGRGAGGVRSTWQHVPRHICNVCGRWLLYCCPGSEGVGTLGHSMGYNFGGYCHNCFDLV